MKRSRVCQGLALGFLSAVLAACAVQEPRPPTTADIMRDRAAAERAQVEAMTELAEQWEEGQRLVQTGQEQIRDGEVRIEEAERNLQRGRQEIEEGTRDIAQGERLMEESERRFREYDPDVEFPAGDLALQ